MSNNITEEICNSDTNETIRANRRGMRTNKRVFPERTERQKGRPRAEDQMLLNGIQWIARSGASWRDLPERYGSWNTVYKALCAIAKIRVV